MKRAWFPDRNGDHRVFWHWQNLKDGGGAWLNGRSWLHLPGAVLGVEWAIGRRHGPGIGLTTSDDGPSVHAVIDLGLASFYPSVEGRFLRRIVPTDTKPYIYRPDMAGRTYTVVRDRDLSLRTFDGRLWWSLWMPVMEHRRGEPRWRRGSWSPLDTLFGRPVFRRTVVESWPRFDLDMPEGTYTASAEREWLTWKRPRWPWARTRMGVTIDVADGVPVPGKGENSWDIDDDAVYSRSTAHDTIMAAVRDFQRDVITERLRLGGVRWQPPQRERSA